MSDTTRVRDLVVAAPSGPWRAKRTADEVVDLDDLGGGGGPLYAVFRFGLAVLPFALVKVVQDEESGLFGIGFAYTQPWNPAADGTLPALEALIAPEYTVGEFGIFAGFTSVIKIDATSSIAAGHFGPQVLEPGATVGGSDLDYAVLNQAGADLSYDDEAGEFTSAGGGLFLVTWQLVTNITEDFA